MRITAADTPLALRLALFLLAASPAVWANPFYGGGGEDTPAKPVAGPGVFLANQAAFKESLADAFGRYKESPDPGVVLAVIAASFAYGILHALGPGHRKTVIFSLFLGRQASWWQPMAAGFFSAGVHAASGGAVLLVLSALRGAVASLTQAEAASIWIDGITLCLIAAVALYLMAGTSVRLLKGQKHEHAGRGAGLYSILAFASLVPCPGAIMVMMFSLYLGLPFLGAVAFLAMSAGMGIVVSAAAYLAWAGRSGVFAALKIRETLVLRLSASLELLSYALMLAFSLYSAWPFVNSLVG